MEEKSAAELSGYKNHQLLFPPPFQGHINSMVQLAHILHNRGFLITIVHTDYNAPHLEPRSRFIVEPICCGLSNQEAQSMDIVELIFTLNKKCERPFRALLEDLQSRKGGFPVSCLITDAVLYFTQDVAEELGIMRMVLRTSSLTSNLVFEAFPVLREKGYLGGGERSKTDDFWISLLYASRTSPSSRLEPQTFSISSSPPSSIQPIEPLPQSLTPQTHLKMLPYKKFDKVSGQCLCHRSPKLTNFLQPLT
ncbi:hypothetical protein AMTRI_Chr08g160560 [Amborella trichopoda]